MGIPSEEKIRFQYPGGLEAYANDKLKAYTKLTRIGDNYPDATRKRRLLQNMLIPGVTDSIYSFLTNSTYSFTECVKYLGQNSRTSDYIIQSHSHRQAHATATIEPEPHAPTMYSEDSVRTLMSVVSRTAFGQVLPEYSIPRGAWSIMQDDPEWRRRFLDKSNEVFQASSSSGFRGGGGDAGATGTDASAAAGTLAIPINIQILKIGLDEVI